MSAPLNITETLICDQLNIHLTECVLWKQVQGDVKSNLLLDWASSSLVRAGFSPSQVSVLFKLLCETDNSALLLWIRGNGEFSTSVYSSLCCHCPLFFPPPLFICFSPTLDLFLPAGAKKHEPLSLQRHAKTLGKENMNICGSTWAWVQVWEGFIFI